MTPDLKYLAFTAILTAALWIPYVVAQVMTNGFLKPPNYVDPTPRPVPLWGKRADRTYLNAVEVFAPFAALVIVAHIAGASREQSSGLQQINTAVSHLDLVVQNNQRETDHLHSTAGELSEQAEILDALVGRFRLDDSAPPIPLLREDAGGLFAA